MAGKTPLFVTGSGGPADQAAEEARAKDLAQRYRCEFVDLRNFHKHHDLFRSVPVDLMFRYNFVPLEERDGNLVIAIADPSQLMMIDEVGLLLGKRLVTKVATLSQITDMLKKTEQSQRVLEEASEGFTLDVIKEDEGGDENHLHRAADPGRRSQPHHPPGRHHHLHRPAAAGQRHPHRNARRLRRSSSTASTACCSRP